MNRRQFLGYGALITGASVMTYQRPELKGLVTSAEAATSILSPAININSDICILTPEQITGPYYFRSPIRSDVRENRNGLPLHLKVQVVNANSCKPLADAIVEIWHCDNRGDYSGFSASRSRRRFDISEYPQSPYTSNSDTFLRGGLQANKDGIVEFTTIFPGWYESRVVHIHLKVHYQGQSFLTTQLYFDDELAKGIYTSHPAYKPYGTPPHTLERDFVLRRHSNGGEGLLLKPQTLSGHLSTEVKLGIA